MDVKALFIEGSRSGYTPMQCGETITTGQLISILEDFPPDTPIYLINDNGYTYGEITEYTIHNGTYSEENGIDIVFND